MCEAEKYAFFHKNNQLAQHISRKILIPIRLKDMQVKIVMIFHK